MRMRTLGLAAALSAGLVHDSNAVVRPNGAEAPLVSADRAPRAHRTIDWTSMTSPGLVGWTVHPGLRGHLRMPNGSRAA